MNGLDLVLKALWELRMVSRTIGIGFGLGSSGRRRLVCQVDGDVSQSDFVDLRPVVAD